MRGTALPKAHEPPARELKGGVEIRRCADGEVAQLQHFIASNWNRDHILARDEALLRWQFDGRRLAGGSSDGPSVLLAWEHGSIVGMLGIIPFDLSIPGATAPGCWLSQWFTTPEARSGGVGSCGPRVPWAFKRFLPSGSTRRQGAFTRRSASKCCRKCQDGSACLIRAVPPA